MPIQHVLYLPDENLQTFTLLSHTFSEILIRSGFSTVGEVFRFELSNIPSGHIVVSVDDMGEGVGIVEECNEINNRYDLTGFCVETDSE